MIAQDFIYPACLKWQSAHPLRSGFNLPKLQLNGTLVSLDKAVHGLPKTLQKFVVHFALAYNETCLYNAFEV